MGKSDWLAIVLGIIFLGAGSLMTAFGERVMRIGGITLIGIGAVGLIFWFAYYRDADAQSPPIINNGPSINTINQSGGSNTINVGPIRLGFDPRIGDQIISKLPPGKPVEVLAIGSESDQQIGLQYAQYLKDKGFDVTASLVGIYGPPPDSKITIGDPSAARVRVLISPSR